MSEQLWSLHTSLPLEIAERMIEAAIAVRRKEKLLPLAIAVLDAGGNLVAFKRENGCGVLRYDIAFGKAWGRTWHGHAHPHDPRSAGQPAFIPECAGSGFGRPLHSHPGRCAGAGCLGAGHRRHWHQR